MVAMPLSASAHIRACRPAVTADMVSLAPQNRLIRARVFTFGGGGAATKVVMGCYDFDTSGNYPFFSSLPDFIYIKAEELQSEPWMESTLRFLSSHLGNQRFGSSIAVDRLTELVFVQAVRVHVSRSQLSRSQLSGWLNAIGDAQIGKSLAAIHANPQEEWSVESLAQNVGMSRSALLKQDDLSILEVANLVGYKSEAAFSKAFKRVTGKPPGFSRKDSVA